MDSTLLLSGVFFLQITGTVFSVHEHQLFHKELCEVQNELFREGVWGRLFQNPPRRSNFEYRNEDWRVYCGNSSQCAGSCLEWSGEYMGELPAIPSLISVTHEQNKTILRWHIADQDTNQTVIYVIQGLGTTGRWIFLDWVRDVGEFVDAEFSQCDVFQYRVAAVNVYGTYGFSQPKNSVPLPEVNQRPHKFHYNQTRHEFSTLVFCSIPEGTLSTDWSCEWGPVTATCPNFVTVQPIFNTFQNTNGRIAQLRIHADGFKCNITTRVKLQLSCGIISALKEVDFSVSDCYPDNDFPCPIQVMSPGRVHAVQFKEDEKRYLLHTKWQAPEDKGSHGVAKYAVQWGRCHHKMPLLPFQFTNQTVVTQPEITFPIVHNSWSYGVKVMALGPLDDADPRKFGLMQAFCFDRSPGKNHDKHPDKGNNGFHPGNIVLDEKGITVVHFPHTPRLHISWSQLLYRDKKLNAVKQYALRWGPLQNQDSRPTIDIEDTALLHGNNTELNVTVNSTGIQYGLQLRYLHSPVEDDDQIKWNTTEILAFLVPDKQDSSNSAAPVPETTNDISLFTTTTTTKDGNREVSSNSPTTTSSSSRPPYELPHILPNESDDNTSYMLAYILVPCCAVILLVAGILITLVMHRKRKQSRLESRLSRDRSQGWDRYNSIHLTPRWTNSHSENGLGFMVPDKWELSRDSLIPGPLLGTGAFGEVIKGCICRSALSHVLEQPANEHHALDLPPADNLPNMVTVAIKMLQDNIEATYRDDFMKEISLMKSIGLHRNIVSMLGCCTVGNPICLVVEHLPNGDLLTYLRDVRLRYQQSEDLSFNETTDYANMAPINITSSDLISFARQIAVGMEFLSQKGYVHRDLAARNILVGQNKTLKIGDFGLARYVYNDKVYVNRRGGKLPVKWMSIEAIFDLTFSTYSDVWSFGIVLFEICTLGGTPYPTLDNSELLRELRHGWRMERPEGCSQELYDLMLRCWKEIPSSRPSFSQLRQVLESMLEQTSAVNYITFPLFFDRDSLSGESSPEFSFDNSISECCSVSGKQENSGHDELTLPDRSEMCEHEKVVNCINQRPKDVNLELSSHYPGDTTARSVNRLPNNTGITSKDIDDDVFDLTSFTDFCFCPEDPARKTFNFEQSCSSCGKLRKSFRDKMADMLPGVCGTNRMSEGFILHVDGCARERMESDLSSSTNSSGDFLLPGTGDSHLKERTHSGDSAISVSSCSLLLGSDQPPPITYPPVVRIICEETKL